MALDNFRSQKIIWDRANKQIFEKIEVNSGDNNGRKLVVQVINQEVTEGLSGTTLSLGWKSRNGAKGLDAFDVVDASKGIFEIYYTTEMLSNIGNIEASLILIDSTGRIESSTFTISVRPSTVDDESVESENSFTALTEALVKVNDLEENYAPRLNEVTAQLAQKVNRVEVDGSRVDFYSGDTVVDSINLAEAGNATAVQSYIDTLVAGGSIQGTTLANGDVLAKHMKASYTPNSKDLSSYSSNAVTTTVYIPNVPLEKGVVSATFSSNANANGFVYVFKRTNINGFTHFFEQVKRVPMAVVAGENNINLDYVSDGNGEEFVGFSGFPMKYSTTGGTSGFFQKSNYNSTDSPILSSNAQLGSTLDFAIYYTYSERIVLNELDKKIEELQSQTIMPSDSLIELNDFVLPNYTELESEVGFVGRWFDKDVNGVPCKATINAGSELYFKVSGTANVDVIFEPNHVKHTPYFAYSIDGAPLARQLITSPSLPTISADEHIIRIVVDGLTESEDKWIGEDGVAFSGVTVDPGGIVKGLLPDNKVGMYFGDSITEGVRALSATENNANGNSASKAFPYIASELLNSISYRIGFGGSGATKDGSGGVPRFGEVIDNMTENRLTPYYKPNYIVVNHGTNDGAADSATFKTAYNSALDKLKIKYPGVPVFTMIPFNQGHAQDIRECVSDRPYCYLIETAGWQVTYSDALHPDVNGGEVAGINLANEITKILGKNFFVVI